MKLSRLTFSLYALLFLGACHHNTEGPAERAGRHIDNAVDDTRASFRHLHDDLSGDRDRDDIEDDDDYYYRHHHD